MHLHNSYVYIYYIYIYVYYIYIYVRMFQICHMSSFVNLFQVLEVFQAWEAPDFHLVADLPTASTQHNSASVPTTNLNNPASQVSQSNSCFFCHLHILKLCQPSFKQMPFPDPN